MKTNPTQAKLKQLLLGVLCASALNFSAFAQNAVITSSTTESGRSYQGVADNAALNVSVGGVTYNGTNIVLSNTFDSSDHDFGAVGRGAYAGNGGILLLTGGAITTSGTYGHGFALEGSSGTVNNVNIETHGRNASGAVTRYSSTLTLTGGTITTNSFGSYGIISDNNSNATVNNVVVKTTGSNGHGVRVAGTSTLAFTGGTISTLNNTAYGIYITSTGSVTLDQVKIATAGAGAHGVVMNSSTLTLTDSDINVTGSAYALTIASSSVTVNLNHHAITGNIHASGTSTLTLSGSNGTVLTGNVAGALGSTVDLTLSGEDTQLIGNLTADSTSTVTLDISDGASFIGSGTVTSLTLEDGAILAFDGGLLVTGGTITVSDGVIVDFSSLTETGTYTVLNWSGATDTGSINAGQFDFAGTGVEGTFTVANNQLTFNATAIPEPSTYFLLGAGLALLLLTAHHRHHHARS
jgi:hypothetical protein